MTATTHLTVGQIRTDGGTQSRAKLDETRIASLADLLLSDTPFDDPVVVFYDGKVNWLADGFHRVAAHYRANVQAVKCVIHQGTQRDAILYSVGANDEHRGLPRTNADKRRAVETLLRDEEWSRKSNVWIAEKCRVGKDLVASLRDNLANETESAETHIPPKRPDTVERRNGSTYSKPGTATSPGADRKRKPQPAQQPRCEGSSALAIEPEQTEEDEPEEQDDDLSAESWEDPSEPDLETEEPRQPVVAQQTEIAQGVTIEALESLRHQRESDPDYEASRELDRQLRAKLGATKVSLMVEFALRGGEVALARLGLDYRSTTEDLKTAHRAETRRCHPDRGGSQREMAEVNAAVALISAFFSEMSKL